MGGRLAGKKIFITGGAQGLGAAMAKGAASEGAKVTVTDINGAGAERLAAELNAAHGAGTAFAFAHDVTNEDQWIAALEGANSAMGGISGLVNNAGISMREGSVEEFSLEGFRRIMSVNVDSVFLGAKHAIKYLAKNQPGSIVNISSIAGLAATPFLGAYCGSKFALEAMSDALRLELAPWGITVSLIEPGAIQSQIWERSTMSATRTLGGVAPESLALYAHPLSRMQEVIAGAAARAIPAEAVARVVARALTVQRPRARYLVGKDARLRAALKWLLPDAAQDRLLAWFLGLSRRE